MKTNHDSTEQNGHKVFACSLELKWSNSVGTTGTIIAGIAIIEILLSLYPQPEAEKKNPPGETTSTHQEVGTLKCNTPANS